MRRFLLLSLVLNAPAPAHVGSRDAFYEGDAGPYHLFVSIRLPQTTPGVAEFELRSRMDDLHEVKVAIASAERFDPSFCRFPISPSEAARIRNSSPLQSGSWPTDRWLP
jgi:hypothetical protein